MSFLRPLLHGLRLGVFGALWILGSELVYARALLPTTVHVDLDLIALYAILFGLAGLAAGCVGLVLRRFGSGVTAVAFGAIVAVVLLALRIHDLTSMNVSLPLDAGLIGFGIAVATCVGVVARAIPPSGQAAAPTVLVALFAPVLVFASKLVVSTCPIELAHPIPVALAMVAAWPLAATFAYRVALARVPARALVAPLWLLPLVAIGLNLRQAAPLEAGRAEAAARAEADDKPPIIFVMIDTLRADHMSLYGYGIPTTKNLETFAASATVYQNAVSQAPSTWQSVPSLLSGETPYRHGGVSETRKLHDDLVLLPERLRDLGYRTMGESANPWVSERYGMTQGFQDFRVYNTDNELVIYDFMKLAMRTAPWQVFSLREHLPPYGYVPFGTLVDDAIQTVRGYDGSQPLFLYVQPIDPHGPYQAPLRYVPAGGAGFTRQDYVSYWALHNGVQVTPRQHDGLLALYDGAVTYTDAQLGRLFDELRTRDLYDRSMIIVVADHGEQFYDHKLWRHSNSLYQPLLHVPLLVKYPHQKVGVLVPERVATFDIMPTVLRQLGQTCPTCEGQPLQQPSRDRPLFSYLMDKDQPKPRLRSVVSEGWKLIRSEQDGKPVEELYNLEIDPQETENVRGKYGRIAADLGALIDRYEAEAGPTPEAETITLAPAEKERLRALGYVQ